MPVFILDDLPRFPPVELAREDGLLAIGGDLSVERLIQAYKKAIFPWYNQGDPILWWSPDPRLVLFPEELHCPRRLRRLIRQERFQVTCNSAFEQVIRSCAETRRCKGEETWITDEIVDAYLRLYRLGFCISAEAWLEGRLAGGLYGVLLGRVFFGESMFTRESNASKVAFVEFMVYLKNRGIRLIDCQTETTHMKRFGARLIPRREFVRRLEQWTV